MPRVAQRERHGEHDVGRFEHAVIAELESDENDEQDVRKHEVQRLHEASAVPKIAVNRVGLSGPCSDEISLVPAPRVIFATMPRARSTHRLSGRCRAVACDSYGRPDLDREALQAFPIGADVLPPMAIRMTSRTPTARP